jgi:hypothetical protein
MAPTVSATASSASGHDSVLSAASKTRETTLAALAYDMANRSIQQEDNAAPIIHLKDREEGQHRPYLSYVK